MKTKILFLSMLLLTGLATGLAQTSGTCGENLTWTLENGTLTISGTGEMGYPSWSSSCSSIITVEIGNGVTSIGSNAFLSCENLSSITIPNSVTTIGAFAFQYCSSLSSITIPNSVTSIGVGPFISCSRLTAIDVDSENEYFSSEDGIMFNKAQTMLKAYPGGRTENSYTIPQSVTRIYDFAFCGCSTLTSITIPNSVTNIGGNAFFSCSGLTSITIPNSVTSIGGHAFSYCNSLSSITIPNSVTSIGRAAFNGCSSLSSITIPSSVTSIEDAFSGCSSLSSIYVEDGNQYFSSENGILFSKDKTMLVRYPAGKTENSYAIPNGVTSIEEGAFNGCSSLSSIMIPNGVTTIGAFAFQYCSSLSSIMIPNGVTSIGYGAFYDCSNLTSITIPGSVTSIGRYAFYGCSSLSSITIPNGVTSIGYGAFEGCSGLTSITIPNSVTSIGENAFSWCGRLSSVTNLNPTPQSITSSVFSNVNLSSATLYVPAEAKAAYQNADVWKNFGTIADYVPSAITAPAAANAVRIYPNPVSNGFRIDGIRESATLTLINENGAVVLSQPVNDGEYVSVSSLAKGLYIVKLQTGNGTLEKKLIKM